jgi:AAA domain
VSTSDEVTVLPDPRRKQVLERWKTGVLGVPEDAQWRVRTAPDAVEHEGPVAFGDLGAHLQPGTGPARDLLLDGQLVTIVGEEGEGKTTLGTQIACQLSAGENVCGHFEVEEPVSPVLIVDVEQSEEDAVIVRDDMISRGLKVDGVFWLSANGRSLDLPEDQEWLTAHVRALRPQVVILDTGTESVTDPSDSKSVKPLMIYLRGLLKHEGVRTILMLAQPRKRTQMESSDTGRRFDDLFGSRVWKGRSSAALYLETSRITVWKQRGSYIRRRWGGTSGQYVRSDDGPAMIVAPQSTDELDRGRRTKVLSIVESRPERYSKSALIEQELEIPGRSRPAWRKTVDDLLHEGVLETVGKYSRLRLKEATPPTPPDPAPEPGRSTTSENVLDEGSAPLESVSGRTPGGSDPAHNARRPGRSRGGLYALSEQP